MAEEPTLAQTAEALRQEATHTTDLVKKMIKNQGRTDGTVYISEELLLLMCDCLTKSSTVITNFAIMDEINQPETRYIYGVQHGGIPGQLSWGHYTEGPFKTELDAAEALQRCANPVCRDTEAYLVRKRVPTIEEKWSRI